MIEETLDVIAIRTREKGLELLYELVGAVPSTVLADPGRLRQILLNYLSNAAKFTEMGEVVVTVRSRPIEDNRHELHFTVRDTGMGIPAKRMNTLFQSFSQVDDSTTRRFGGTGLGLAISARLANMMGGKAWAESEEGRGSCFHFTAVVGIPQATPKHAPETSVQPLAGVRTWIVDDNETSRRILSRQVEAWGAIARATGNPAEALGWTERGDAVDLVLLDSNTPQRTGADLSQRLRALHGDRIKLVLLNAGGAVLPREDALRMGLQLQLMKPLRRSPLLHAMQRLFDRPSSPVVRPQTESSETPAVPESKSTRQSLRVLVAEDNPINLKMITHVLVRLGYRADVAGNGKEALQALRRQPYDVVLMDVQMPVMDGIEASREISRTFPVGNRPRVIALTAGVTDEDRQACMDAGMEDFLAKPLVLPALLAALAKCKRLDSQERSEDMGAARGLVG